MATIGERIREARLANNMTQSELAAKVGLKFSAIHKYEAGLVVNLKRDTISALASALDVSPSWLMCLDDTQAGEKIVFYDRFVALCAEISKTPAAVARDLKIDKSTISCWKKRGTKPTDVTVKKISDYFGITVDDLLGEKKEPDPQIGSLSPTKQRLLDAVDDLTDSQIDRLLGIISEAKKLL